MKPASLTKRLTVPRLRAWLALLFLLLAIPIIALVWHAYSQLKWEAFHQHRSMAEELSGRINTNLTSLVQQAETRSSTDYSFLVVAGDDTAPFLQRSALSEFPVIKDIPGTIGYFQIDSNGLFSTPALPDDDTLPQSVGVNSADLQARQALGAQLVAILSENRLVDDLTDQAIELADVGDVANARLQSRRDQAQSTSDKSADKEAKKEIIETQDNSQPSRSSKVDSQQAFDRLRNLGSSILSRSDNRHSESGVGTDTEQAVANAPVTTKRKELNYIAETAEKSNSGQVSNALAERDTQVRTVRENTATRASQDANQQSPNTEQKLPPSGSQRITAFESDVDPIEFSLLDSGHFVAYRKVWRDKQRLIQGALIDRQALIDQLIREPYLQAGVSSMSSLSLTYQNSALDTFRGAESGRRYDANLDSRLLGTMLYRHRLADPLNELELVFRIKNLPPGPGASVLAWVTAALAVVFLGGFYLLYRAGREQIALAAQQQDFVSAVSHELKTPLTSIRLYGEMLKQGWAPDEKKQQYYTFIHDESERLSRLIENVLKLSRINRKELVLDLQTIEVAELMTTMQDTLQQQARPSGFEVQFRVDPSVEATSVVVDRDSIMQILVNLLDNAIKFSKHAEIKVVEVSAKKYGNDSVALSVRDYGPGIPKNQLVNIFQMFYRSENELTRETVGTGIGLAIVHQLCEAMDAEVSVVNREPGAEFFIQLGALQ